MVMRLCRVRVLVIGLTAVSLLLVLYPLLVLLQAALEPEGLAVMEERASAVSDGCSRDSSEDPAIPSLGAITIRALRPNNLDQGYQLLADNKQLLSHLIVDDRHKVLYCYVPKVACTNWKRLMMVLSGTTNQTNPLLIPPDSVHRKYALHKLEQYTPEEILHRLHTYKKFLFVRDPLERVLSAFRNKFEKNYTSSAYFKKRFGVKIQQMFRKGVDSLNVSPTGDGTTFAEFVSYLVRTAKQQRLRSLNEHWAPVVELCQPCLTRYDYIGKYETLEQDAATLLLTLRAPFSLKMPDAKPSVTASLIPEYLAALTPAQREQLQQLFADDIVLFGYTYRDTQQRP